MEYRVKIEHGAMTNAPIYEDHKRARNWLAVIRLDPKAPSGIGRKFMEKARGDRYFYLTDGLEVGQPVEFGADYYTGGGRKQASRWYGVVAEITEDEIVFERAADARSAVERAKEIAAQPAESPLAKYSTDELITELRRRGIDISPT